MKTMTKWTLMLAAALSLLNTGCGSLFPSNPNGDLTIERVTANGSTYAEVTDITDPAAITMANTPADATLFIQFSLPMDGTSIQGLPLTESTDQGVVSIDQTIACAMYADATTTPAAPGTPLTVSGNWPAGSLVCYYPQAPAQAEGHQIVIIPGAALAAGSYTIGGTAKAYNDKTLAFQVTFTVVGP